MKIEKYVCKSFTFVKNWYFNDKPSVAAHLCRNISVAQCKVIRIPESRKFLLVESVLLGIGIQNPAFGIQNPTKEWIQNPLAERPFQIVLTAFTRIHATTVMLKATLETVQTRPCRPDRADQTVQTRPCRPRLFRWRIATVTAREILINSYITYHPLDFDTDMAKVPY